MNKEEMIDLLEKFKSALLSKATDGEMDDELFKNARNMIMKSEFFKIIPQFIKATRNKEEFRRYMQGEFPSYRERRKYICDEINGLILQVEDFNGNDPFIEFHNIKNLTLIDSGGFGQVYIYKNEYLDMDFAIKIYNPVFVSSTEQLEGEKRFFREAKMLFKLNDSHICRIFDAGRLEEKPYIKMELIKGYNLYKLLDNFGLLSVSKTKIIIKDILLGLEHAHNNGIIHRDLKPSNVMFSENEKKFKIIDFGVSAFLDTDNNTRLTKTGECIVGGGFIDPLLQTNPKLRDVRSDIYSVGAIWYYLLCGTPPGGSDMRKILIDNRADIDEEVINVIMKCLSNDINNRYLNVSELLQQV